MKDEFSVLYEKILDNQYWEIDDLDRLIELSKEEGFVCGVLSANRWIPVTETYPKDRERVLCKRVSFAKNRKGEDVILNDGVQIQVWNEDCQYWDQEDGDDYELDKDKVTHWRYIELPAK